MRHRNAILVLVSLLLLLTACDGTAEDTATSSEPRFTTSSAPTVTTNAPSTTSTTAPPWAGTDDTRMCTAVGCDSILTIELSEVDITPEATYDVEICVKGDCTTETITIDVPYPGTGEIDRGETEKKSGTLAGRMLVWADGDYIEYHLPEGDYSSSAFVTFTLTDADGSVLAQTDDTTEVSLERSQPNGPDCPPICFSARMTV